MRKEFANAAALRIISIASSMTAGMASIKLNAVYLKDKEGAYSWIAVASIIAIYLPFLDGGFRTVINQRLLASKDPGESGMLLRFGAALYSRIYLLALVLGTLIVSCFGLSPGGRASGLSAAFFPTLGFAAGLTVVGGMMLQQLVGLGLQSRMFGIAIGSAWLNLASLWIGFHFGLAEWACPFSWFVVSAANVASAVVCLRGPQKGIPLLSFQTPPGFGTLWKELRPQAFAAARLQICSIVLFSMDTIVVSSLCAKSQADAYAAMARFVAIARNMLQTGGEVLWPIMAQKGVGEVGRSHILLRTNGWIYGAAFGAMAVTLSPFCSDYMGARWVVPQAVLLMTCLRGVIVGLATSATYPLYALGRFDTVARWLQAELVLAALILYPMHRWMGVEGIALGLLISTAGGTLFPLFLAYAEASHTRVGKVLLIGWARALIAAAVSGGVALALLPIGGRFWIPLAAGALGASACAVVAVVLAILRGAGHNRHHQTVKDRVLSILSRI